YFAPMNVFIPCPSTKERGPARGLVCDRSQSEASTVDDKVALIVGAGDGTGGAIAKRFARDGFIACAVRRTAAKLGPLVAEIEAGGGRARAFGRDARREEQMVALVEEIERDLGPIEVAVFNVGANVPASILEETARKYFKIWEMACFGGFLMG